MLDNENHILISLVREQLPQLLDIEMTGVQPMTKISYQDLVFALKQMAPEELKEWDRKARMADIKRRIMKNKELMKQPKPDPAKIGLPKYLKRILDVRKQVDCIEIVPDTSYRY